MEISCEGKYFLSSSPSGYLVKDAYANDGTDSFPPFRKGGEKDGAPGDMGIGPTIHLLVNRSGAKLIRLRRQTIQVWAPGVSMSV